MMIQPMYDSARIWALIGFGAAFLLPLLGFFWYVIAQRNRCSGCAAVWFSVAAFLCLSSATFLWCSHVQGDTFLHLARIDLPPALQVAFSLDLSPITLVLSLCTLFISCVLQLYSMYYMPSTTKGSYYALLLLFSGAMLGLYAMTDLFWMWFFWGVIGMCSYLLIGYATARPAVAVASSESLLIGKLSDVGFLGALCLLWALCGSTSLPILSAKLPSLPTYAPFATICGLCFIWAAVGKSAQFPLQMWLVSAMRAPTPVSALLHSGTLVVAGIFLLGKVAFLLTPALKEVLFYLGLGTALLAALSACVQTHAKAFLAYCTISQLGYMMIMLGLGQVGLAFMYMVVHAVAKSLLFMGVGAIAKQLGAANGWREPIYTLLRMGGHWRSCPLPYIACACGAAVLLGLPLTAGATVKEGLLTALWHKDGWSLGVGVLTFCCTGFYLGRFLYLLFSKRSALQHAHPLPLQQSWYVQLPLWLGVVCCVGVVYRYPELGGRAWLAAIMQGVDVPSTFATPLQRVLSGLPLLVAGTAYLHGIKTNGRTLRNHSRWFYGCLRHHFYLAQAYQRVLWLLHVLFSSVYRVEKGFVMSLGGVLLGKGSLLFALLIHILDKYVLLGGCKLLATACVSTGRVMHAVVRYHLPMRMAWVMLFILCLLVMLVYLSPTFSS